MYNYLKKIFYNIILSLLLLSNFSCKKLVEVDAPVTSTNANNVYKNDATAAAVLTGIYTNIGSLFSGGVGFSVELGLSADELTLFGGAASSNVQYIALYQNALTSSTAITNYLPWSSFYSYILTVNSAIEGLTESNTLTPEIKQQLLGEAKFLRGLIYFYLVNLYGDVPLALTSDYRINAGLSKSKLNTIYQQVIIDLNEAQLLLSSNFVAANGKDQTTERVRPNKWAATALLARVYLYNKEWANAEIQSTALINNTTLFALQTDLANVFLKNSKEAIWQLQPVTSGRNTEDGYIFILPSSGPTLISFNVYLSNFLLNAFESNDKRRTKWVDSVIANGVRYYYPSKYKINQSNSLSEYLMIFRLAEQYLIRAEARAHLNNFSGSASDLNVIRNRAGLTNFTSGDKALLLASILKERQVEFFSELGHRWLDLKRTETIDAVMGIVTPQKGGQWLPYKQFFPIPLLDIQRNPNLIQNTGY